MSFFRHEEIYRPMDNRNVPGRPWHDRPRPHRYDEFPTGYSSAGCAPAEPASASPAEAHLAGIGSGSTIELQRTANRLLTPCLTQGDNPNRCIYCEVDADNETFLLNNGKWYRVRSDFLGIVNNSFNEVMNCTLAYLTILMKTKRLITGALQKLRRMNTF